MSNVEFKPGEKLQICLSRPNSSTSWGFRLQGGTDFSTPLSIQSVNPNSVSECCGLKPGDAILTINSSVSDSMTHDEAKAEIMRSGNEILLLVERGAVKIWKPAVTPLSELRPQELRTIQTATGEELTPVQKTSLAINKPPDESSRIGSSHNRVAQPFGGAASKSAVPNIVHAQFNSPMGLYSADNIADTYHQQSQGIQTQMSGLDIGEQPVGTRIASTGQILHQEECPEGLSAATSHLPSDSSHNASSHSTSPPSPSSSSPPSQSAVDREQADDAPIAQSRTFSKLQEQMAAEADNSPGFRSVSAPQAKPPSEKAQQPSMRCGGCDMLATGVIVRANGVPYHVACFKCTSCSVNLKQKGYFVVNGKLYCDIHAKRVAQPPGSNMVATAVYR